MVVIYMYNAPGQVQTIPCGQIILIYIFFSQFSHFLQGSAGEGEVEAGGCKPRIEVIVKFKKKIVEVGSGANKMGGGRGSDGG